MDKTSLSVSVKALFTKTNSRLKFSTTKALISTQLFYNLYLKYMSINIIKPFSIEMVDYMSGILQAFKRKTKKI